MVIVYLNQVSCQIVLKEATLLLQGCLPSVETTLLINILKVFNLVFKFKVTQAENECVNYKGGIYNVTLSR